MREPTATKVLFVSLFATAILLAGCSLIGGAIGSLSDKKSNKTTTIPGWEVATVEPGTNVEILGKNGHRVTGLFTGIESLPQDEYVSIFDASRREYSELASLPAPGDSIFVNYISAARVEGVLIGYYMDSIAIRVGANARVRSVQLSVIVSIKRKNGSLFDPNLITMLVQEGKLPVLSAITYVADSERRMIAVNDVDRITYRTKTHRALTGFLIGAAIDTAILLVIAADNRKAKRRRDACRLDRDCVSSCPLVYSFNGVEYVLDSETFGGAIFEAAQRIDLDNLDHLKAVDGTYRLSLRNENDETEYVDQLSLLVVDHALNTRVVPTFTGELHVISQPQPPISAVDDLGRDIREMIAETDERVWISNPLGRDPGSVESARDGIELEFSRPTGTEQVKLLFNVQNTWWVSYLAGQVLALQGRELEAWYEELNESQEARSVLFEAIIREGALGIEVWDGTAWQYGGFVWEVGPSLSKDLVVVLDLNEVEGDVLKIRLESTAGLWMINSVLADYSFDDSMDRTELLPVSAITHTGADILAKLSAEDGSYYVMPTTEDRAELIFNAPQIDPTRARTFILQSAGYYKIHVAPVGEPQTALATRLLTEPGAIGTFSILKMNEFVSAVIAEDWQ